MSDVAIDKQGVRFLTPQTTAVVIAAVAFLLGLFGPDLFRSPDWLVLPIADTFGEALTWFAREASIAGIAVQDITRGIAAGVNAPIEWAVTLLADGIEGGRGLNRTRIVPPLSWFAIGCATVYLAYTLGGNRLAASVSFAIAYLVVFGLWHNAMVTLASVLVSLVMATLIGLALGIWSYRSEKVESVTRAIMNVMQTVPIFAYLIPTLLLFGYGPSAALLATVIYALPPMVHNTVLALKSVPAETTECGRMAGCTSRQLLWQVQLPTALPKLAVGLNQVIMMTLNMVIIASMIGAGGLGFDVLQALRKLDIGSGLEAGLGIVALAIVLDRMSQAAARRSANGLSRPKGRWPVWVVMGALLVGGTLAALALPLLQDWPKAWQISTAPFWNALVSWINQVAFDTLEAVRAFLLLNIMRPLRDLLMGAPWFAVFALLGLIGYRVGGIGLAATCLGYATFILVSGFWAPAMNSLYLMIISVLLALMMGVPLGIWLSTEERLHPVANFSLDTLQTLPTLIYLLPAVMLFRIGDVSAVIAITAYALAPAVRYTMTGLIQVPSDRIEAAQMSGCTPRQILLFVKLPSAFPPLLLGLNQTIMMAFSMLVIAALVGTKDLGQQVLIGLNRSIVGQGIIAGLCVAALSLIADALLKAWAAKGERKMGIKAA